MITDTLPHVHKSVQKIFNMPPCLNALPSKAPVKLRTSKSNLFTSPLIPCCYLHSWIFSFLSVLQHHSPSIGNQHFQHRSYPLAFGYGLCDPLMELQRLTEIDEASVTRPTTLHPSQQLWFTKQNVKAALTDTNPFK